MSDYPFKPFPGSSHHWALERGAALGRGLRVLDVGAGRGEVLRALLERTGGQGVAVEPAWTPPVPDGLRWLRRLEDLDEGDFDLALVLDVLEHVSEPRAFLADIVARLRPGGTLLVSVPNVAHWSVRLSLLAGRFDYAERGILDRTHQRFFTRDSLRALLLAEGLEIARSDAAVVPLELLLPPAVHRSRAWGASRAVRRKAARLWPGLLAYQLLAEARRPGGAARDVPRPQAVLGGR